MKRPLAAALIVAPAVLAAGVASAGLMAISPVAPVPQVDPSNVVEDTLADAGLPIDLPALPAVEQLADLGAVTTQAAEVVQEVLPMATPVLPSAVLEAVTDPTAAVGPDVAAAVDAAHGAIATVTDVAAAPVAALAPVAGIVEQLAGNSAVATVEGVVGSLGLPVDVPALPAALDPMALVDTVRTTVAGLGLPIGLPRLP